jgi:hypothetical protein
MIDAIRDWLPITKRNRVALGFAVAALVMFVTWNFLPYYDYNYGSSHITYIRDGWMFMHLWSKYFDPDFYFGMIHSTEFSGFVKLGLVISHLINSLLVFITIPFWKIIHASKYLSIPLALSNFVFGCVLLIVLTKNQYDPPYMAMRLFLSSSAMLALSAALFIFKNELGLLRHELEVKKMMSGGVSR